METQVVTTTIFSVSPTASPNGTANSRASVPLGAVIGGAIAGAVLAVAVTVGWICWGRRIKRDRQKQQEELNKSRKTRWNTIQNAQISGPKHLSYGPTLKGSRDDKRVKFTDDEKAPTPLPPASSERMDLEKAKHMLFDNPNVAPPRPAWYPDFTLRSSGSFTWPHRKLSQNSIRSNNNNNTPESSTAPPQTGSVSLDEERRAIPHKASNVSARSNASSESRQGRVRASLIIAALGNTNSSHTGDRQSSSSLWNQLFRAMPGTRVSQHSTGESTYQPTEDEKTYPAGTAM